MFGWLGVNAAKLFAESTGYHQDFNVNVQTHGAGAMDISSLRSSTFVLFLIGSRRYVLAGGMVRKLTLAKSKLANITSTIRFFEAGDEVGVAAF
jgi:hypothetical protein